MPNKGSSLTKFLIDRGDIVHTSHLSYFSIMMYEEIAINSLQTTY